MMYKLFRFFLKIPNKVYAWGLAGCWACCSFISMNAQMLQGAHTNLYENFYRSSMQLDYYFETIKYEEQMPEEVLTRAKSLLESEGCARDTVRLTVSNGTPLPTDQKRGGHMGGTVNGKAIIAGGTGWSNDKQTKYWFKNTLQFCEGKWIPGPDLPKPLAYAMYASDPTGFYIAGGTPDGMEVSRSVYRLPSLDQKAVWEQLPDLPEAISFGVGAIVENHFYVACGNSGGVKMNKMWMLDLRRPQNGWQACKPVPAAGRTLAMLVASDQYLYLLGGLANDTPFTVLKDAYRYHTAKKVWERLADLPMTGYAWTGAPLNKNSLLVTGRAFGEIDKGIWTLDLKTMNMRKVGETIVPATTAPLVPVKPGTWWLIGGEPDANKNRNAEVSELRLKNVD